MIRCLFSELARYNKPCHTCHVVCGCGSTTGLGNQECSDLGLVIVQIRHEKTQTSCDNSLDWLTYKRRLRRRQSDATKSSVAHVVYQTDTEWAASLQRE